MNNGITPRSISKYSHKKFWFTCDVCEHNFQHTLTNITSDKWCHYCFNYLKICDDNKCKYCFNNSFASFIGKTIKKKLKIDCWNYKMNNDITPRDITIRNSKKFWFTCDVCSHNFKKTNKYNNI